MGLLLFAVVATQVSWGDLADVVLRAHLPTLMLAVLIAAVDRVWMASKWLYLSRRLGLSATFLAALRAYFVAGLVAISAQVQVAGDVARAAAFGHKTRNPPLSALSVLLERVTGVVALGTLASVGILIGRAHLADGWFREAGPIGAGLLLAFMFCTAALLVVPERLIRLALQILPQRTGLVGKLRSTLGAVPATGLGRSLSVFYLLTLLEQLVPVVQFVVFARAFHLPVPVLVALSVMPVIAFLSRLPVSIEAVGVREGLYVLLFGAAGVSSEAALAVALAARGVDIVVALLGTAVTGLSWERIMLTRSDPQRTGRRSDGGGGQ